MHGCGSLQDTRIQQDSSQLPASEIIHETPISEEGWEFLDHCEVYLIISCPGQAQGCGGGDESDTLTITHS